MQRHAASPADCRSRGLLRKSLHGTRKSDKITVVSSIRPTLRRRLEAAGYELVDVAAEIRATEPALAELYHSLGHGLASSHLQEYKGHFLHFRLPRGCELSASGEVPGTRDTGAVGGPANVTIHLRD